MMPLKRIVGDARVVAFGEATHGTREFFQLKHRMVEFLANQMGLLIFTIEAKMPEAYQLNDYLLHAAGDAKALLRGMFTPLGMHDSGYTHTETIIPHRAAWYERSVSGLPNARF